MGRSQKNLSKKTSPLVDFNLVPELEKYCPRKKTRAPLQKKKKGKERFAVAENGRGSSSR